MVPAGRRSNHRARPILLASVRIWWDDVARLEVESEQAIFHDSERIGQFGIGNAIVQLLRIGAQVVELICFV